MKAEEIAHKYVHGEHNALTDSQEKKDMAEDIRAYHQSRVNEVYNEVYQKWFNSLDEDFEYWIKNKLLKK